jgi:hypothetical protein
MTTFKRTVLTLVAALTLVLGSSLAPVEAAPGYPGWQKLNAAVLRPGGGVQGCFVNVRVWDGYGHAGGNAELLSCSLGTGWTADLKVRTVAKDAYGVQWTGWGCCWYSYSEAISPFGYSGTNACVTVRFKYNGVAQTQAGTCVF